ncbi:guanine-N(7)-methyltransferase domain-containing protein [Gorgonomyces haynaldii]|nr:guanine-N(7)-methyltransferase domain-containing protein [Gorgonomyces haynaldii]
MSVREHYNVKPEKKGREREESVIVHLKKFNNWIKSVLISQFVTKHDKVLDLACGKGGDLLKWKNGRIKELFGCDISEVSVDQARRRYANSFAFKATFHAVDCFSLDFRKIVPVDTFDLVSCQFALHYAFESEERALIALENVSRSLIRGGHFIGTIPNSNWLVKKLRSVEGLEFGNSIYKVVFDQKDSYPIFGHRYRFILEDAIDDCPEYLIHQPTLVRLAKKCSLELIHITPFHEFFHQNWKEHYEVFKRMRVLGDDPFPDDDWEAIGIYSCFAFKKI